MIGTALSCGWIWTSLAMLVQFVCYIRPGELCSLTGGQIVSPVAAAGAHAHHGGFIIGMQELNKAAKSGEFGESVFLD